MEAATIEPTTTNGTGEPDPVTSAGGPGDTGADLVVTGNGQQLSFDVGGKKPTASKLRVQGRSIDVEGEFLKEGLIECRVVLKVTSVEFADQEDASTGQVVDCTRTAKARIVSFERA